MKLANKYGVTLLTACLVSGMAMAHQVSQEDSRETAPRTLTLLKDCQVVGEYKMTDEQVSSYLDLQQAEQKMDVLYKPTAEFEQQLHQYSQQIEKLTELAIEETDESLHINKHYLAQQEQVVAKLDTLMAAHQHEFAALGQQGKLISAKAERFSQTMKATFADIDYDQIQIKSGQDSQLKGQCQHGSISFNS